jgi:hypothetical protein
MQKIFTGRLTRSQVAATVFALGWATCPMGFAIERGKQEGKRIVRETVSRAVGVEQADSLLRQIHGMDFGAVSATASAGDVITLERPEGSYVFSQMAADSDNNISGHVAMFDPGGQETGEVIINRIAVLDENRIDFDISSSTSAATAAASVNWSGAGSIVGLSGGAQGLGMAFVAVDGEDTRPMLLNYGSLDLSGRQASTLPLVSSLTASSTGGVASTDTATNDGGTCGDGSVASVAVGAVVGICVAVVIIVVVLYLCIVLLFWTFCY